MERRFGKKTAGMRSYQKRARSGCYAIVGTVVSSEIKSGGPSVAQGETKAEKVPICPRLSLKREERELTLIQSGGSIGGFSPPMQTLKAPTKFQTDKKKGSTLRPPKIGRSRYRLG